MKDENVKGKRNDPVPIGLEKYTKPNGSLVVNNNNQLAFVPKDLPPSVAYDREMIMLLAEAERRVGELKGKGDELKNPHILLGSYLRREAVLSSRIEGTLASLDDLNRYEVVGNVGIGNVDSLRLLEVINYVHALELALKRVGEGDQEIDLSIIREAHKILMTRVRGQEKSPGEFRNRQNWVMFREKVVYAPPPTETVPALLRSLETFIQEEHGDIPVLVQCAMIHYQFEAIHPFRDGNGRIGRLLLPLILHKKGLLPEPLLYISSFFDRHLEEYYGGLLEVSRRSRWNRWIKFFLRAFAVQAEETISSVKRLVYLQRHYSNILHQRNASGNAVFLMENLFKNPYVTVPDAKKILGISYQSASGVITALVKAGILYRTDIVSRSRVFLAGEIEEALSTEQGHAEATRWGDR